MNICGIILAKSNSNRFPGKNRLLFEENVKLLIELCGEENVYMFTDDPLIEGKSLNNGINVFWRGVNANGDEQPYIDILKFGYMNIPKKYDYIVTILANTIGHTLEPIKKGIDILKADPLGVNLIRSFDKIGNQSGIFILRADNIPEKLYHEGAIISNGREIHYKEELEN